MPPNTTPKPFFVREAVLTYKRSSVKTLPVSSSRDLAPFVRSLLGDKLVEHFIVIALSARQKPIGWNTVAIGSTVSCPINVADVLRFVVVAAAPRFVVAHNHPSGDPTPSSDDLLLTERIGDAARLLGLDLVDHVIVAEDAHYSFFDAGMRLSSGASR